MINLDEQQILGEATCALPEIITKSNMSLTIDLKHLEDSSRPSHPGKLGQLIICAEECVSSKISTELALRCLDLEHKDLFARNVSPLIIECFNFNRNGKHDLIGKAEKSLADLEKMHSMGSGVHLYLPTPVGNNYQTKVLKSQLFVDTFSESVQHTFLDYLAGGCGLNFMVAIDFTASNGNPRLLDSLHYIDPIGRPIAYQKVDGIRGIMMAYTSALYNVSLAGPTLFGPVISEASVIASQSLGNK